MTRDDGLGNGLGTTAGRGDGGGGAVNGVRSSDFDKNFLKIPSMALPQSLVREYSFFIGLCADVSEGGDMSLPKPSPPPLSSATLYIVATPIGNLEDITLRALRTLRECDVVAAEDTRRTGQLLNYFGISKPLLSYFRFNESKRSEEIIERLARGEKVALVTDAGTPAISDPGERVVRAAIANHFRVESVPGPCALIAALSTSGLATEEFHFCGFLPVKAGQRRKRLLALRHVPGTLVLYESPYRVGKLFEELQEVFTDARVVVARELTKKFEEVRRGTPAELTQAFRERSFKGEFVVLIEPAHRPPRSRGDDSSDEHEPS